MDMGSKHRNTGTQWEHRNNNAQGHNGHADMGTGMGHENGTGKKRLSEAEEMEEKETHDNPHRRVEKD